MKEDQLADALEEVRGSLIADGADLKVLYFDGAAARVQLLFGPDVCQDCIMPKDFLEQIILMKLQESVPELERVELDDPRLK